MIVVTGGSGFIGSHLCSLLSESGYKVQILDIAPPKAEAEAEFVRASVLDILRLQRLFEKAEAVIHLAALVDVQASVSDPYADFQVNAQGTINVLEAARRRGIKKVVFASSAAVYGNPKTLPIAESHPTEPLSPYGLSKLSAERYVISYNQIYGMENFALRLFNVFGRGQSAQSPYSGVIAKFAEAFKSNSQPLIYGDGKQTRDFVHVDDVAEAFLRALELQPNGSPINIGSGKQTSIIGLFEKMRAISGKELLPKFLPARKGDIQHSCADISLARKSLGYSPKIPLEQGLKELLSE
ncbi:MAG: NAD-dependent epimerase/dehydratase family protein [Candidatus Micrarchaeota archaeon]|nr:NAD-dependent epimerase/dehydratase family protein [Candidatus Micrarchaeota archaeon]